MGPGDCDPVWQVCSETTLCYDREFLLLSLKEALRADVFQCLVRGLGQCPSTRYIAGIGGTDMLCLRRLGLPDPEADRLAGSGSALFGYIHEPFGRMVAFDLTFEG